MTNRDCLSFATVAALAIVLCKLFALAGGAHG